MTIELYVYVFTGHNQTLISVMLPLPASSRGDHIERRRSASDPSRAALQEERRPSEGGQPSVRPGEAGGTLQEQEAQQILQESQK